MTHFRTLEWTGSALRLLDQRRLPAETIYLDLGDAREVAEAIRAMIVRGAPAIGAAAAYGLALAAQRAPAERLLDALDGPEQVHRCGARATQQRGGLVQRLQQAPGWCVLGGQGQAVGSCCADGRRAAHRHRPDRLGYLWRIA